jgi:fructan beta-fructosidase
MKLLKCILFATIMCPGLGAGLQAQTVDQKVYQEQYRSQVHFSPKEHWMNDPNGMVYYNGIYHLFYQYFPGGTTWGPMHWGHAESKDLMHWKEQSIALYPDSLGYIFSGSAVVDTHNTSGFGKNGVTPLVAIFTSHDPKGEKAGTNNFQNQSIAYSLDEGKTWTKYAGNPVVKNPGIRDFRDPKVRWYESEKKWIMTLATKDRITFFSSPDLKAWKKESEFGLDRGAHGGVWECPDLFPLQLNGKTYWVLLVSINPGGPNNGSATQYFIGQFNGHQFVESGAGKEIKWIDYGPDDYAGVTWSNTGDRSLFLGWMSNWMYAGQVPTEKWRNAMTIPRVLGLKQVNDDLYLTSNPVVELKKLTLSPIEGKLIVNKKLPAQYILKFKTVNTKNWSVELGNNTGEKLVLGYDQASNRYYIDRASSGTIAFNPEFAKRTYAPRLTKDQSSNIELVVDASSIELFADNGLTVMTSLFFPHTPYDSYRIKSENGLVVKSIKLLPMVSAWK